MAKCVECGQKGMFLKVNANGLCLDCLSSKLHEATQQIASLEAQITPEFKDAKAVLDTLSHAKEELSSIEKSIDEKKKVKAEIEAEIISCKEQLLFVSDAVEMESFSLYVPRFDFSKSDDYKDRLAELRNAQKQMLRDHIAVIYGTNWTVNGSKAEGKKLLADMEKLFVRSFNNECDAAVSDVKFSNMDRCRERILKAFETINKLGRVNNMSLSYQYRQSKLDELALAYEYQCKKQEEKNSSARSVSSSAKKRGSLKRSRRLARKPKRKRSTISRRWKSSNCSLPPAKAMRSGLPFWKSRTI